MNTLPNQPVPPPHERKSDLRKPFLTSSGAFRVLKMRNLLVLGVIVLVSGWLAVYSPLFHKTAPVGIQLTDLHSVKQFQRLFNADTGMPRLVLIYSPTCALCINSAHWLQTEILEKYPRAKLRVYAIWTSKLVFDSRDQWDAAGLTDRRVVHLWDPQDIMGNWFFYQFPDYQGTTWDTYLLFGKDATWDTQPSSLMSSGAPPIDYEDTIAQSIRPLLNG